MERTDATSFEARSKAVFDASVGNLDGRTRTALTRARYAALAELERSHQPLSWRAFGPLAGVAAAAFVLLALFAPLHLTLQPEGQAIPLEDLDIVAEAESFELLENLEFYAWLDSARALPAEG